MAMYKKRRHLCDVAYANWHLGDYRPLELWSRRTQKPKRDIKRGRAPSHLGAVRKELRSMRQHRTMLLCPNWRREKRIVLPRGMLEQTPGALQEDLKHFLYTIANRNKQTKNAQVAATYFRAKHYHRPRSISLPCSEWERVGQLQYNRHLNVLLKIMGIIC